MRSSCLLPNLTVLEWHDFSCHIPIIFTHQLLTPTLVSLNATLAEADGATLLSFFQNLPFLCSSLKSIRFFLSAPSGPSSTTIEALSRTICNQKSLEEVILHTPIDDIALGYLSTLSTLKALTLSDVTRSRLRTRSFLPQGPLFCSLETLEFEASDLDLVTSLLRACDQKFHAFRLCYGDMLTSKAVVALLNLLASRSRTKPILDFTLVNGDACSALQRADTAPRYHLSYKTIQPLMIFGSLRSFMIEWNEQMSLDDDEIANLARNWPLLQDFALYCSSGPFPTKYPTLRGLLALVTFCPQLRMVSLPLDARQVPDVEARECMVSFDTITLPESPIYQALPVAEFLFKHLPCVRVVEAMFLDLQETDLAQVAYEERWRQVEEHLEEFRRSLPDSGSAELGSVDEVMDIDFDGY